MPLLSHRCDLGWIELDWVVPASAQDTWTHLVSLDHLPAWLGEPVAGSFVEGGTLVVDHGAGYLCESRVLRLASGRRIAMTWDFPDEPSSRVIIQVNPTGAALTLGPTVQTTLRLRHADLGDLTSTYLPTWLTHLTYLEASLVGEPLPPSHFWRLCDTFTALDRVPAPEPAMAWSF